MLSLSRRSAGLKKAAVSLLLVVFLGVVGLSTGWATATIQLRGAYLKDAGGTRIAQGQTLGMLLLVASTGDSTFTTPSSSFTLSLYNPVAPGSDDVLLFQSYLYGNAGGGGTAGEFRELTGSIPIGSMMANGTIAPGDPLMLYWFPYVSYTSTTLPAGAQYGSYQGSTTATDLDNSSPWVVPSNNSSGYNLIFYTQDAGSNVNSATTGTTYGESVLTVVPEPSSLLAFSLFAASGAAAVARRRISRAFSETV